MGLSYTKEEIIEELKGVLKDNADCLYKSNMVFRKGNIKDTNIPYSEEIIAQLYANGYIVHNAFIDNVSEIEREESYYTKSHEELVKIRNVGSDQEEKNYVKDLFIDNPFEKELGKTIDFEVPLKDCESDCAGKIDLITFNETTAELFLVEVKKDGSEETALRCCLEIQTYLQKIADIEKFVDDFYNAGKLPTKDLKVKLAVIVFENSVAGAEFKDETRINLQKLVKDFDIKVCFAK